MPRGNKDIAKYNSERTPEERREIASKAGKASAEVRKRRKSFGEIFEDFLNQDIKDNKGKEMKGAEALAMKVVEKALKGDLRAWELIRDSVGEKPVDVINVTSIEKEVREEVEIMVDEYAERASDMVFDK